jgi:hypothetical protein
MKTRLVCSFVLAILLIAFISGCGQRGMNNPTGVTGGIGQIADNPGGGGSLIGTWYSEDINEDWKDVWYLTFNTDGSFSDERYIYEMYAGEWYLDYVYSWNGSYQVNGNQLILNYDDEDAIYLTYSIQGDSITLYFDGGYVTLTRYYDDKETKKSVSKDETNINSTRHHNSFLKHFAETVKQ